MRYVYSANYPLEAHMVKHLLESEGIAAHIHGEMLQGAIGESPPAAGHVKVSVSDEDFERARALIEEAENN